MEQLSSAAVIARVGELKKSQQADRMDRQRIRAIMDGGVDGIGAIMAWQLGKQTMSREQVAKAYGVDLPTVNLLASGGERLAQRVGRMPILKPPHANDDKIRAKHQKRRDILAGWDRRQRIELQFPQVGRWLPGYSEIMWVPRQRRDATGTPYLAMELRDSFDVFTGWWGVEEQPDDAVVERVVPLRVLKKAYPEIDWDEADKKLRQSRPGNGLHIFGSSRSQHPSTVVYDGESTGVVVDEYMNRSGTYYTIAELGLGLTFIPNPLKHSAPFVAARRAVFSKRISHFHHAIGLMAMMAKLNILGLVVGEDSAFRETNIIGEMQGKVYKRGRWSVNLFERGTQIDRPTTDNAVQLWQQIDRLERQIRIGTGYDVAQDGISPNSFATGNGVRELRQGANSIVDEYHLILRHAVERLDWMRLEWAEQVWPNRKCQIFDFKSGQPMSYTPARDIKGVYETRRIYGAMATWDDPTRAVTGLQLLQAGVLAVEDVQENLDGLDDPTRTNELNAARRAEDTLFQRLTQKTQEDPVADAALAEIMAEPHRKSEILTKYFTAKPPEPSPEELAMMQGMMPGAAGAQQGEAPQGPPPSVTSILSRLTGAGGEGGIQTVGTMRR